DEGMTLQNICDTLNLKGIPSSKGRKWIPTTLIGHLARKTGILRQSLYKGVVTFNRAAYRKHPYTGNRTTFLRPEKDWLTIPIPELALFTDGYFDGVQKKIENRSNLRKQRISLNEVLTKDEKAAHEARMEKRRRQKQAKVRKLPTYIVSGRLICADHNEPMQTGRAKLYNCPNRKCQNRNLRLERDLLPPLLADLHRFDGASLNDFFTTSKIERQRLQSKKDEWGQKLETGRKEIQNILDLFGKDRKTSDTKSWLEDRALKIIRFQFEIDKLSKELILLTPTTKVEKESIVMAFQRAVKTITSAYHNNTFDQLSTSTVRAWVKNFHISSEWNEDKTKWGIRVETQYNWVQILKSLRS
ncbi:MAG: recombinase family protein, partial [Magnetovibrio sp.]|nr:recombinase family protein [Magnetovibrio sp.]